MRCAPVRANCGQPGATPAWHAALSTRKPISSVSQSSGRLSIALDSAPKHAAMRRKPRKSNCGRTRCMGVEACKCEAGRATRGQENACMRERRDSHQSPYLDWREAPTRLSPRQPKSRLWRLDAYGENAAIRHTHWRPASTASHTRGVPVRVIVMSTATIVSSKKSGAVARIASSSSTHVAPKRTAQE